MYYRLVRLTRTFKIIARTSIDMELTKNLNIYLRQTETAIFLATKHEKAIMAISYLNFSIQKTHQNSKKC